MISKNIINKIIISLVIAVVMVGGIFLIFKGQVVSVADTNTVIIDRGGLTEFQTEADLPNENIADFTDDGAALRAFGRASYKVSP